MGSGEGHVERYASYFLSFFATEKKTRDMSFSTFRIHWAKVRFTGCFVRHKRSNRTVGFDHKMIGTCSCIHGDEVKETRSE